MVFLSKLDCPDGSGKYRLLLQDSGEARLIQTGFPSNAWSFPNDTPRERQHHHCDYQSLFGRTST